MGLFFKTEEEKKAALHKKQENCHHYKECIDTRVEGQGIIIDTHRCKKCGHISEESGR